MEILTINGQPIISGDNYFTLPDVVVTTNPQTYEDFIINIDGVDKKQSTWNDFLL